jgi:hypothetical protein
MTYLARLVFTLALAGAMSPDFNRQEPISLDLKDASVTDVITMLGALANAPVSIAPDVTGTVTIQVTDVPYAKVLEMIAAHNALSIRFEDGKLVATRAKSASVPAPRLERAIKDRRIPVEEYTKAASTTKPLYLQLQNGGGDVCARVVFDGGATYELPVPGSSSTATVTQFGWDPVTRTRFVAFELPGARPVAYALGEGEKFGVRLQSGDGDVQWTVGPAAPAGGCREAARVPDRRTSRSALLLRLRIEERKEGGPEVVMAPQVQLQRGTSFSVRSGMMRDSGQHDEIVLFGYLAGDGNAVAVALVGSGIRTDPSDRREYVYSQLSQVGSGSKIGFTPLAADETSLVTLPAGPVWDRPLELSGSVVRTP